METSNQGDKKPKSYYVDFHKRNRNGGQRSNRKGNSRFSEVPEVAFGNKGFLITSVDEVKSYLEMRNLLEDYYIQLYPKSVDSRLPPADGTTIEEDLESELKTLRKEKPFKQVKTLCRNTLFINITKDFLFIDPVRIVDKLFIDLEETKSVKTSNTYKVLPVLSTFRSSPACVKEAISDALSSSIQDKDDLRTFFIEIQNRGNYKLSQEDKQNLIEVIAETVSILRPKWKVGRDNADYMMVLVLLKNVCCLSIVMNYFKRSKYNITKFIEDTSEVN